ncbi:hypothetical protein [Methylobacterium oryzisoli]|uniref:hypothetical protein n=1 Tax=Methylobacterium oryzisoli TaxID=3385502 RepID=UPI003891C68E
MSLIDRPPQEVEHEQRLHRERTSELAGQAQPMTTPSRLRWRPTDHREIDTHSLDPPLTAGDAGDAF